MGQPVTMIEPVHGRNCTVQAADVEDFRKRGYRLPGEEPAAAKAAKEAADDGPGEDKAEKPAASGRTRRPRTAAAKAAKEAADDDPGEDDGNEDDAEE